MATLTEYFDCSWYCKFLFSLFLCSSSPFLTYSTHPINSMCATQKYNFKWQQQYYWLKVYSTIFYSVGIVPNTCSTSANFLHIINNHWIPFSNLITRLILPSARFVWNEKVTGFLIFTFICVGTQFILHTMINIYTYVETAVIAVTHPCMNEWMRMTRIFLVSIVVAPYADRKENWTLLSVWWRVSAFKQSINGFYRVWRCMCVQDDMERLALSPQYIIH